MNNIYKGNAKIISLLWLTAVIVLLRFSSAAHPFSAIRYLNTFSEFNGKDTIKKPATDTLALKKSANNLDSPVKYHADDSAVMDVPGKKMYLYGKKSNVVYDDNDLTAPVIAFDQSTSLVTAHMLKDSTGTIIFPTFTQAGSQSQMDTVIFNMKTQKGLTKGTYTRQGEMYVYGEKIKKVSDDVFFALKGRFTTCNLDTPHFAFVSKRIKMVNQKMAYSGMVHPEFEGVPVPIFLPFGIYPLSRGRHSGLMAPAFTANEQFGLALENLGYYKILNDNWDVITRATLYSYGAFTASINPRYYKRYRYSGNLSVDWQQFKTNFKGDPDYTTNRTINVRWSHRVDNKAKPGVTFSANVNAGSSRFNSQVPNSPLTNFTNQMSSSVSYAKVWKDKPFNLSVNANHNQNTRLRLVNINLPDVAFNVNTLYPFRRKEVTGAMKWYENLGIALNTTARSLTSFYDTSGSIVQQIKNNLQWGIANNVPITLSLPQIGPLQFSPTVTYQERYFQKKTRYSWNGADNKIDTTVTKGIFSAREMVFGMTATTRIFGMFGFGKKSKIQAIRHEIRPTLSANYKPDLNRKNYYNTQVDTSGRLQRYSFYENTVYGGFGEGKFGGLTFGIDNNISMKVRRGGKDTATDLRKISILDGLSINGSYNFLADSFQFSNLSVNARTNILDKFNITASAQFDPYQYENGRRINKLVWANRPLSLGMLTGGNVSLQSAFQGGDKKKSGSLNAASNNGLLPGGNVDANGMPLDEYQQEALYVRNNPGEFADFTIPWSLDFAYSLRFNKVQRADRSFYTAVNQDVNWNASMNLTPKWKIGVTGFYNITAKELGTVSMFLSRDMHCWQMAINISPVGRFRFFNITINPKSPILRDLRVNRTRYFFDL